MITEVARLARRSKGGILRRASDCLCGRSPSLFAVNHFGAGIQIGIQCPEFYPPSLIPAVESCLLTEMIMLDMDISPDPARAGSYEEAASIIQDAITAWNAQPAFLHLQEQALLEAATKPAAGSKSTKGRL